MTTPPPPGGQQRRACASPLRVSPSLSLFSLSSSICSAHLRSWRISVLGASPFLAHQCSLLFILGHRNNARTSHSLLGFGLRFVPQGMDFHCRDPGQRSNCHKGAWRNGSASDSRSEGWEFKSLCPHSYFIPGISLSSDHTLPFMGKHTEMQASSCQST